MQLLVVNQLALSLGLCANVILIPLRRIDGQQVCYALKVTPETRYRSWRPSPRDYGKRTPLINGPSQVVNFKGQMNRANVPRRGAEPAYG